SACDAVAVAWRGFCFAPAESFCGRFEHGAQPLVLQILQTEFQRVELNTLRQLVNVHLARKMIGRRSQRAIRTLLERRLRLMKLVALMRNRVNRSQARRAGIVIVKLPSGDLSVAAHAAFDLDHTGGSEVSPGELFLARPDQLDRL